MADLNYVIAGGGLAAASAIEGIREVDRSGPITLLSLERELPYHRPPLSKGFLAGKEPIESVRVHDAAWYRDNKVRVKLGQVAKSIHIGKQSVETESGERINYDRLLIATGSSARKLTVPGSDAQGILYLRTLADSYALKGAIKPGTKVVIVGGGFIGMEVGATARGLGAQVTVLEMGPVVYRGFASPDISAFFQKVLEEHGVVVKTNKQVERFLVTGGRVSAVQTKDGEQIPCDLALVGVGSEPNTGWLATSGFTIDKGALIVNVRLETPGKNVWAAGDITRFPDPVSKQPRRLEHWDNAQAQGKQAGRNMAGANEPFTHQALFFSDMFDLTVNVLGDADAPTSVEIKGSMTPNSPNFTAYYQRNGKLTGVVMVNLQAENRDVEFAENQKLVAAGKMP
jgi:3-phenylpropionate/trans-cinnamate dioxygenase ferredoxin reductase subunit